MTNENSHTMKHTLTLLTALSIRNNCLRKRLNLNP